MGKAAAMRATVPLRVGFDSAQPDGDGAKQEGDFGQRKG
jgi:hypothetical protein